MADPGGARVREGPTEGPTHGPARDPQHTDALRPSRQGRLRQPRGRFASLGLFSTHPETAPSRRIMDCPRRPLV